MTTKAVEPTLHAISVITPEPDGERHRVICFCGADWVISKKELEAGETKIEWHQKYANRAPTKPD